MDPKKAASSQQSVGSTAASDVKKGAETNKTRRDVMQFLETLDIDAEDNEEEEGEVDAKTSEKKTSALSTEGSNKGKKGIAASGAPAASSPSANQSGPSQNKRMESQKVLDFIDEITKEAESRISSPRNSTTSAFTPEKQPNTAANSTSQWGWGNLLQSANVLVNNTKTFRSSITDLVGDSITSVTQELKSKAHAAQDAFETAVAGENRGVGSDGAEKHNYFATLVNQKNLSTLTSNLKQTLGSVIDTIAPPLKNISKINVKFVNNVDLKLSADFIDRIMNEILDFYDSTEIFYEFAVEDSSPILNHFTDLKCTQSNFENLPVGYDAGYGAAVSLLRILTQFEREDKQPSTPLAAPNSGLKGEATETELSEVYIVAQPFLLNFDISAPPQQGTNSEEPPQKLCICIVLHDPKNNIKLDTFTQILPRNAWDSFEQPVLDSDLLLQSQLHIQPQSETKPESASISTSTSNSENLDAESKNAISDEYKDQTKPILSGNKTRNAVEDPSGALVITKECFIESLMLGLKSISNEYVFKLLSLPLPLTKPKPSPKPNED